LAWGGKLELQGRGMGFGNRGGLKWISSKECCLRVDFGY
jgi:hypothetical protein